MLRDLDGLLFLFLDDGPLDLLSFGIVGKLLLGIAILASVYESITCSRGDNNFSPGITGQMGTEQLPRKVYYVLIWLHAIPISFDLSQMVVRIWNDVMGIRRLKPEATGQT